MVTLIKIYQVDYSFNSVYNIVDKVVDIYLFRIMKKLTVNKNYNS